MKSLRYRLGYAIAFLSASATSAFATETGNSTVIAGSCPFELRVNAQTQTGGTTIVTIEPTNFFVVSRTLFTFITGQSGPYRFGYYAPVRAEVIYFNNQLTFARETRVPTLS